ncbi:hypothetical protein [Faecalibacillus intestinalis]|nr:hypothetical protein [Faecalibacillus intestinalis]
MLEFKTFIVNEQGQVVCDCSNYPDEKINRILKDHEEWSVKCLEI